MNKILKKADKKMHRFKNGEIIADPLYPNLTSENFRRANSTNKKVEKLKNKIIKIDYKGTKNLSELYKKYGENNIVYDYEKGKYIYNKKKLKRR